MSKDVALRLKVIEDLRNYKEVNKVSNNNLSRMIGVSGDSVKGWLSGQYKPRDKFIVNMFNLGITAHKPRGVRQQEKVSEVLNSIDAKNSVEKRKYTKRVLTPDIVKNQIKLLLDDYIDGLDTPMTYSELKQQRSEFIDKLCYTCKQGA